MRDRWADKDGRAGPLRGIGGDVKEGGKVAWRGVDRTVTRLNLLEANDGWGVSANKEEEFFIVGKVATAVPL